MEAQLFPPVLTVKSLQSQLGRAAALLQRRESRTTAGVRGPSPGSHHYRLTLGATPRIWRERRAVLLIGSQRALEALHLLIIDPHSNAQSAPWYFTSKESEAHRKENEARVVNT